MPFTRETQKYAEHVKYKKLIPNLYASIHSDL